MKSNIVSMRIVAAAALLAILAASDHAGGWNDGSRLATVESLVDHGTWAIDDSVFTQTAKNRAALVADPYGPAGREECPHGTLDKLYVRGHFYSDKSPVPALPLAGAYWVWTRAGGAKFTEDARQPILFLTVASSGLAFVLAVMAVDVLARRRLDGCSRLLVTASFALSTVALPYAQAVNNHILLLAVVGWLLVFTDSSNPLTFARLVTIGAMTGVAYSIDLGAGPVVCLGIGLWSIAKTKSLPKTMIVVASAFPFVALHHWFNYRVGGSWKPANAIPEYFNWPGCPFNSANLTGGWRHRDAGAFLIYAADLLLGRRGFINYNLPLWLAGIGAIVIWRQSRDHRRELSLCAFWFVGIWLIYAATSNNLSGECCSVRWFVPLLTPGYYVLIHLLHKQSAMRRQLAWLSFCGAALATGMTANGPWSGRMPWGFWPILAIAGLGWWWAAVRRLSQSSAPTTNLRRAA